MIPRMRFRLEPNLTTRQICRPSPRPERTFCDLGWSATKITGSLRYRQASWRDGCTEAFDGAGCEPGGEPGVPGADRGDGPGPARARRAPGPRRVVRGSH